MYKLTSTSRQSRLHEQKRPLTITGTKIPLTVSEPKKPLLQYNLPTVNPDDLQSQTSSISTIQRAKYVLRPKSSMTELSKKSDEESVQSTEPQVKPITRPTSSPMSKLSSLSQKSVQSTEPQVKPITRPTSSPMSRLSLSQKSVQSTEPQVKPITRPNSSGVKKSKKSIKEQSVSNLRMKLLELLNQVSEFNTKSTNSKISNICSKLMYILTYFLKNNILVSTQLVASFYTLFEILSKNEYIPDFTLITLLSYCKKVPLYKSTVTDFFKLVYSTNFDCDILYDSDLHAEVLTNYLKMLLVYFMCCCKCQTDFSELDSIKIVYNVYGWNIEYIKATYSEKLLELYSTLIQNNTCVSKQKTTSFYPEKIKFPNYKYFNNMYDLLIKHIEDKESFIWKLFVDRLKNPDELNYIFSIGITYYDELFLKVSCVLLQLFNSQEIDYLIKFVEVATFDTDTVVKISPDILQFNKTIAFLVCLVTEGNNTGHAVVAIIDNKYKKCVIYDSSNFMDSTNKSNEKYRKLLIKLKSCLHSLLPTYSVDLLGEKVAATLNIAMNEYNISKSPKGYCVIFSLLSIVMFCYAYNYSDEAIVDDEHFIENVINAYTTSYAKYTDQTMVSLLHKFIFIIYQYMFYCIHFMLKNNDVININGTSIINLIVEKTYPNLSDTLYGAKLKYKFKENNIEFSVDNTDIQFNLDDTPKQFEQYKDFAMEVLFTISTSSSSNKCTLKILQNYVNKMSSYKDGITRLYKWHDESMQDPE